jgi:hypothetical protein
MGREGPSGHVRVSAARLTFAIETRRLKPSIDASRRRRGAACPRLSGALMQAAKPRRVKPRRVTPYEPSEISSRRAIEPGLNRQSRYIRCGTSVLRPNLGFSLIASMPFVEKGYPWT